MTVGVEDTTQQKNSCELISILSNLGLFLSPTTFTYSHQKL